MIKKKILVVDDDEKINQLLSEYLLKFNYVVTSALTPSEGFKIIQSTPPDIIILDIMMPEMDGFEFCKKLRVNSDIPVIMLTARGDVTDKIVGLELGADDYLSKPFEPRELVARIQSVLKRSDNKLSKNKKFTFGDLEIDCASNSAQLLGEDLNLTTLEFYALKLFCENAGNVVSRDTLYEKLKGYNDESFDRSIDVMISRLRNKIGDNPQKPKYIKTIRGTGYKFIG